MTQAILNWPFGEDKTCLAKILGGNATRNTSMVLEFGNLGILTKANDPEDPRQGWHRITPQAYVVMKQEVDPNTSLPVIGFMADPRAGTAIAGRMARQGAAIETQRDSTKAMLKEVLHELLVEQGLVKPVVVEDEVEAAPEPVVEQEPESPQQVLSAETAEEDDPFAELGMELPEEASVPVEAPKKAPDKKAAVKGSRKRKMSVKVP